MPTKARVWIALVATFCAVPAILADEPAPQQPPPAQQQRRREVRWNVPDGQKYKNVEHGSFRSPSMEIEIGYSVYLPPGYADSDARFPVIYFLHGAQADETSDAGRISKMLATLIDEKKIPPVICVFPNGGLSWFADRPETKVMGETSVIKELLPLIDRTYRTRATRDGRAIVGFSMGGGGAIRLALKHPDLFSSAAAWAASFMPRGGRGVGNANAGEAPALPAELRVDHLRAVAGKVRLLLIVGDQDTTCARHKPFLDNLEQAAYAAQYKVLEGVTHRIGLYAESVGEETAKFLTDGFTR